MLPLPAPPDPWRERNPACARECQASWFGFAIHRIPPDEIGETLALFDSILTLAEPQT